GLERREEGRDPVIVREEACGRDGTQWHRAVVCEDELACTAARDDCLSDAENGAHIRTRARERPDAAEPRARRRFLRCAPAAALRTRLRLWGRWRRLRLGRGGWRSRLRTPGPEIRRGGEPEHQRGRNGRDERRG